MLHVVDCADENMGDNFEQVQEVLKEIDADEIPQLIVCNKIIYLKKLLELLVQGQTEPCLGICTTRQGLELILKAITELVGEAIREVKLKLPASAGHYLGQFYRLDAIQQKEYDDLGNCLLSVRLADADWHRLVKQSQGELESLVVL